MNYELPRLLSCGKRDTKKTGLKPKKSWTKVLTFIVALSHALKGVASQKQILRNVRY